MSTQNIVIDNGSGVLKAGMSGDPVPNIKFPSILGTPKFKQIHGSNTKDLYVGDEALKMSGVCTLKNPIDNGIVTDWEGMNSVWEYCFANQLRVDASEHNILMTEAPLNPK